MSYVNELIVRETADGRRVIDTPAPLPPRGLAHRSLTGLWTRERALVAMGFDLEHLAEAYTVTRGALGAERDGAPDWKTRLKAVDQMYALSGVVAREGVQVNAKFSGPVAITWRSAAPVSPSPAPADVVDVSADDLGSLP